MELGETREVIGLVGLGPHDDGEFELGWWTWKEYWGRGYAGEAAWAFVMHARDVMGLERPGNSRQAGGHSVAYYSMQL